MQEFRDFHEALQEWERYGGAMAYYTVVPKFSRAERGDIVLRELNRVGYCDPAIFAPYDVYLVGDDEQILEFCDGAPRRATERALLNGGLSEEQVAELLQDWQEPDLNILDDTNDVYSVVNRVLDLRDRGVDLDDVTIEDNDICEWRDTQDRSEILAAICARHIGECYPYDGLNADLDAFGLDMQDYYPVADGGAVLTGDIVDMNSSDFESYAVYMDACAIPFDELGSHAQNAIRRDDDNEASIIPATPDEPESTTHSTLPDALTSLTGKLGFAMCYRYPYYIVGPCAAIARFSDVSPYWATVAAIYRERDIDDAIRLASNSVQRADWDYTRTPYTDTPPTDYGCFHMAYVLAAGMDPEDDCACSELSKEWHGHPVGSVVVRNRSINVILTPAYTLN